MSQLESLGGPGWARVGPGGPGPPSLFFRLFPLGWHPATRIENPQLQQTRFQKPSKHPTSLPPWAGGLKPPECPKSYTWASQGWFGSLFQGRKVEELSRQAARKPQAWRPLCGWLMCCRPKAGPDCPGVGVQHPDWVSAPSLWPCTLTGEVPAG